MSARAAYRAAVLSILAAGIAVGGHAHAQDASDRAARQADQIIRNQAEQQRVQQDRAQQGLRRAPDGAAASEPLRQASTGDTPCIPVRVIEVTGATLIAPRTIDAAVQSWRGRCLGVAGINGVLQAVTYLYLERGYIASRAFLPEQDLSKGTLAIRVVEGRLQAIVPRGNAGTAGEIATAFPGMTDEAVNLRQIEQGLDQINRLSSMKATIALEPGKEPGDSVLGVTIDQTKPWSIGLGADNYGSPSTGIYESRVSLGLDSLLGFNDAWSFSYQRSMDNSPLFFSGDSPNSDMATASFSIPYGRFTAGVDGSWSQYRSSIQGQISTIDTSGYSVSVAPYLSWLIDRDQTSKTWVTGRLAWKSTDNFLLGTRLDTASRTLSVGELEFGHSRQLLGGTLNASLGYERGLAILGAVDDATAAMDSPNGQFDKITASLGYSRAQEFRPGSLVFSTLASGQWSNDPLFASEQMALGGVYSVRGARDTQLSGSRAFYVRNELSWLLPPPAQPDLAATFGRVEPYVGLDIGRSYRNIDDGSLGGTMTGGVIGIRNRGGRLGFDLSYTRILSIDATSERVPRPGGLLLARMSAQF